MNGRKARNQTLTFFFSPGTKFIPARPKFWQCPTLISQKVLRCIGSTELLQTWHEHANSLRLRMPKMKNGSRWIRLGARGDKMVIFGPKNSFSSLLSEQGRDKEFQRHIRVPCIELHRLTLACICRYPTSSERRGDPPWTTHPIPNFKIHFFSQPQILAQTSNSGWKGALNYFQILAKS